MGIIETTSKKNQDLRYSTAISLKSVISYEMSSVLIEVKNVKIMSIRNIKSII